ncbi:MAG TPA: ABC transporter substrate-binding protein [Gaiellaceae bacterium]|nr:ABC transporter substrate-binding protein [Gaiellaceae bacterium]
MLTRKRGGGAAAIAVALLVVIVASIGLSGAGASQRSAFALPRGQTLYMSGNQWSPNNDVNPAKNWDYVTGLVGFNYETAFRYDPMKGTFIPWLATSGKWTDKTTYVMNVRKNVKWTDGKTLTPADVAYSFKLAKIATHPQHPLWTDTGLQGVNAKGNQVIFKFAKSHSYQQFDYYRYMVAIVPQHVFQRWSKTELATANLNLTSGKIVGTGPYMYQSGYGASSETVTWKKNTNWWATKQLGIKVAPTYVVDISNSSNAAALGNFAAGNIDLFNNFAPKSAIRGQTKTYYSKAPWHLSANTVWLFPNTTQKPLNDAVFRRALATSIDISQILDKAYQGLAIKASPTGLLPIWNKYVDGQTVKKYGFSYSTPKAKQLLAAAGYKDTNGDGYVENKDGSAINLKIVCPNGWSDWMTAIQVIQSSAKAAGIHLTVGYPDYGTMADDRGHGRFDLLLGNDRQMSNSPWTYYQYIYQLPLSGNQTTANYERFTDNAAWKEVQQLDKTPTSDKSQYQAQLTVLQKTFLQKLPAIPLWYNGMWAMFNTKYWTNWPSSSQNKYTDVSWRNYWQMTSIDMLTHLKSAGS